MRVKPIHILLTSLVISTIIAYELLNNIYASIPVGVLCSSLITSFVEEIFKIEP